jgi:cytidylate kinase
VKIFLTASPESRAQRRYKELIEKGESVTYDDVLADMIKRDYDDSHRAVSPLSKAADAIEVDTSTLTLEESIACMKETVLAHLPR